MALAGGSRAGTLAMRNTPRRRLASDLEEKERIAALGPVVTVRGAVNEYLNERSTALDARGKLKHLLASALAEKPLAALTATDLTKWRSSLLDKKARKTSDKKMGEAAVRRVVNDAKACLNLAAKRHSEKLPPTIRDTIRDGLAVSRGVKIENEREKQILSEADIRSVVDAAWKIDKEQRWDGDLGRMILVLAATGARFSQVVRLRVGDLQVTQGRLMMPSSRKGSGAKAAQIPVPIADDAVEVLNLATVGRRGSDPLLMRPRWRRAPRPGFGVMEKCGRGPWGEASSLTHVWKAVVRRAGLQDDLVAYSLRHTSITRGLSAGLPTQLVAQLHDTSVTMIERYYGRFVADALHKLARSVVVSLMPPPVASFPPLRKVDG